MPVGSTSPTATWSDIRASCRRPSQGGGTLDTPWNTSWTPLHKTGTVLLITADHGNVEEMVRRNKKTGALQRDASGVFAGGLDQPQLNPVPFVLVDPTSAGPCPPPPELMSPEASPEVGATHPHPRRGHALHDYLPSPRRRDSK